MRKKSTVVETDSPVAQLIHSHVKQYHNDTPHSEIAAACGYNTPNNISMIRHGSSKLPIDRAIRMANAIDLDPVKLVLLVHEEYLQPANTALDEIGVLPHNEFEAGAVIALLASLRETGDKRRNNNVELNGHIEQFIKSLK